MLNLHTGTKRNNPAPKFAAGVLFLVLIAADDPVWADQIDDCMGQQQKIYEMPQQFSQEGDVTCPAGDLVGFPPRIRRNDRSGFVIYTAPEGTIILNQSLSSIAIQNLSQNNGKFGAPSISADGRTVAVPIACDGKGLGEGRSWQSIRVSGTIVRKPSQDTLKSWAIQCVRCVAERNCPPVAPVTGP